MRLTKASSGTTSLPKSAMTRRLVRVAFERACYRVRNVNIFQHWLSLVHGTLRIIPLSFTMHLFISNSVVALYVVSRKL